MENRFDMVNSMYDKMMLYDHLQLYSEICEI